MDIEIGSQFRYSGGGYTILQQLLTDILGRPFPFIMRDAVLIKLDMSQSTYEQPLPQALAGRAASGHRADGSVLPGRRHTYAEMAAAGLWTPRTALALFAREIMLAKEGKSDRMRQNWLVPVIILLLVYTAFAPQLQEIVNGLANWMSGVMGADAFGGEHAFKNIALGLCLLFLIILGVSLALYLQNLDQSNWKQALMSRLTILMVLFALAWLVNSTNAIIIT